MIINDEDTLVRVQRQSGLWRAIAYPDSVHDPLSQSLGVAEEVGEMCHAVLKHRQGIRGYDIERTRKEVGDAIADIIIYACAVADCYDLNVADELSKAWAHVRARNLVQNSDMGDSAPVGCIPCATIPGQPCEHTNNGLRAVQQRLARAQFDGGLPRGSGPLGMPQPGDRVNIIVNPVDYGTNFGIHSDDAIGDQSDGFEPINDDVYMGEFIDDPIPTHGHESADVPLDGTEASPFSKPYNGPTVTVAFDPIDDDITHDDDRWSLQEADDE